MELVVNNNNNNIYIKYMNKNTKLFPFLKEIFLKENVYTLFQEK